MLGSKAIGQAIQPGPNAGYAEVSKDQPGDYGAGTQLLLMVRESWRALAPNRYAAPRAAMVNTENYSGVYFQNQTPAQASGSQNQRGMMNRIRSSYAHFIPKP